MAIKVGDYVAMGEYNVPQGFRVSRLDAGYATCVWISAEGCGQVEVPVDWLAEIEDGSVQISTGD